MNRGKTAVLIVGAIVFILGIVFGLQGAGVIGGSSLMSGNPSYIYIGGVVAIIGLVMFALSLRGRGAAPPAA